MKKIFQITLLLSSLLFFMGVVFAAECQFTGDVRADFDRCNPSIGIQTEPNKDFNILQENGDFRQLVSQMTRRFQVITSVIAIGVIVWIGFMLVLPFGAEEKENAKKKIFSVLVGFLVMISASIIISAIVNIVYDLFR